MLSSLYGPGFGVGAAGPACEAGNLHDRTHPDLLEQLLAVETDTPRLAVGRVTIAGGAAPAVTVPTDVHTSGAVREAP